MMMGVSLLMKSSECLNQLVVSNGTLQIILHSPGGVDSLFQCAGVKPTPEYKAKIVEFFKEVDVDHSNDLDLMEFFNFMKLLYKYNQGMPMPAHVVWLALWAVSDLYC